jgi:hypothetical protein
MSGLLSSVSAAQQVASQLLYDYFTLLLPVSTIVASMSLTSKVQVKAEQREIAVKWCRNGLITRSGGDVIAPILTEALPADDERRTFTVRYTAYCGPQRNYPSGQVIHGTPWPTNSGDWRRPMCLPCG